MKSPILAPKVLRHYAPTPKVFAALMAMGIKDKAIYEGWEPSEHWSKIKLPAGEGLGVLDGLRAFGGKVAIKKAIAHFHENGTPIVDLETKQDSLRHGVAMFDAATGPRKPSAKYDRLSKDEALDARRTAKGQMRRNDAGVIWFDKELKVHEKIKLTGWSKGALYAAFKKSHGMTGRPPKNPIT